MPQSGRTYLLSGSAIARFTAECVDATANGSASREGIKKLPVSRTNPTSLAVLIDADNVSSRIIPGLLAEVAKLGNAHTRRIYGDWTNLALGHWKGILLEHAIQPVQQLCNTPGKNATDIALVIDAMDLLHTAPLQGFCIVSSDGDFTRLALRIRESGRPVYGFGEKKTPLSFRAACNQFFHTEQFFLPASEPACEPMSPAEPVATALPATPACKRKTKEELGADTALINLLKEAIKKGPAKDGWVNLSAVGSHLVQQGRAFDHKQHGYAKLIGLIEATGLFKTLRKDKAVLIRYEKPNKTATSSC